MTLKSMCQRQQVGQAKTLLVPAKNPYRRDFGHVAQSDLPTDERVTVFAEDVTCSYCLSVISRLLANRRNRELLHIGWRFETAKALK
jgi:hypothetical protein